MRRRAHVISFVFMFWLKNLSKFVGRKALPLDPLLSPLQCLFKIQNICLQFSSVTLNTINSSVLTLGFFFFFFCLLFSAFWFPHGLCSKHDTFYIRDVLCSSFLIVFSKKAKTQKQNTIFFFLMTWVQWLCSLLYLWETILYILALDSLNWRTWQIPLEHNEYDKKLYI